MSAPERREQELPLEPRTPEVLRRRSSLRESMKRLPGSKGRQELPAPKRQERRQEQEQRLRRRQRR